MQMRRKRAINGEREIPALSFEMALRHFTEPKGLLKA